MERIIVGVREQARELSIWRHSLVTTTRKGVIVVSVSFYALSIHANSEMFGKVLVGWFRSVRNVCGRETQSLVLGRDDVLPGVYDVLHRALEGEEFLTRCSTR